MRCVNCGSELLPGKQFCHACGTRVEAPCPSCGSAIGPGFRFCPECGTRIDAEAGGAPAPEDRLDRLQRQIPSVLAEKIRASQALVAGERKLVTVLFCDLVGSTAIAERLDPEEYRDLLERYMEIAFREIYGVEGIVTQLAGDGFMALFGAPVAHEDAPQRAVHAALAIRDALHALDAELRATRGLGLQCRISVHTGPVVVGTVGSDLKMDYTAIGDTTNLASRLQALAEPGTILVSEATHRLVRGFFAVQPARRLEVKGKREPVVAYEVLGASESVTPMAIAEARGLTPFVGRHEELAQLSACYERLAGRLSQVVAIVGPGGSGKSRLLYEFTQRLAGEPVALFEARCSAMTQSVPYAPWVSMLRQHFELAPDDDAAGISTKLKRKLGEQYAELESDDPLLCQMLAVGGNNDAREGDASQDEAKGQTFEAVARLVYVTSERTPVIMTIEDLHWIDEPSREMLELAVARIQRGRVMLVVTHRPDYQPTWQIKAAFTQLTLAPLSDDHTLAIVRGVAGGPLPQELEQRLLLKAEGNPFFTEEITRALAEEGYLLRSDGQVSLTRPVDEIRLPGTVEELIGARLDRLGPPAKRVLQVAAVIGRQFDRAQLEQVLGDEGIDISAELAALERRGVIHRKTVFSSDEFRFGESLTQQVAYEGLLLKQRRELHERIGCMVEALPGVQAAERAVLLAHHFTRSDSRGRAMAALIDAARDAERVPSFRMAARFYREAWDLGRNMIDAEHDTAVQRLALQAAHGACRMAVIYGIDDDFDVGESARRGRTLAEALGDLDALADLCALHGMAMTGLGRDRFGDGLALIEEGAAVAERAGLTVSRTRIARALAWAYLIDGRFAAAEEVIDQAIAEFGRRGQPSSDLALGAHFMRDRMRYHRDDLETALASAGETYALAAQANNRTVQCGSAAMVAQVHLARGQYRGARTWADRSLDIAQGIGNLSQMRTASAVALLASRELGEPGGPTRYFGILEQGIAAGIEPLNAELTVEALLAVGEARRAEAYARRMYARSGGRLREAICSAALGHVLAHGGLARAAEAQRWYDRATVLVGELGARGIGARVRLGVAGMHAAHGNRETALRHLEDAAATLRDLGLARDLARAERLRVELDATVPTSA